MFLQRNGATWRNPFLYTTKHTYQATKTRNWNFITKKKPPRRRRRRRILLEVGIHEIDEVQTPTKKVEKPNLSQILANHRQSQNTIIVAGRNNREYCCHGIMVVLHNNRDHDANASSWLIIIMGDPNSCVFSTYYCSHTIWNFSRVSAVFSTCRCLL